MRQCHADHLHRVIAGNADAAFGQCHTGIFAQRHAVIDVVPLQALEASARHQCLANSVANKVTVPGVNVRIRGFIRRCGIFAQRRQQFIFSLSHCAFRIRDAFILQLMMLATEHRKEIVNCVNTVLLLGKHLCTDSGFIRSGRWRWGRRCRHLWLRLLRFALGSIARRGDHVTNAVWHLFKVLNTF